jgi:hypothetical protein
MAISAGTADKGAIRITALATALSLLALSAEATTVSRPFHGCEAADIQALVAQGHEAWTGDHHTLGPWSLHHSASLDCQSGNCRARLTMTTDHSGKLLAAEAVSAPLALTSRPRHLGQSLTLDGEAAQSLRDNLGEAAFLADGKVKRVMMDYGTLAEAVTIRIRTEVSCRQDETRCTLEADPVAYIAYDDRTPCGSIAASFPATN